jgi:hypothetical protein
MIQALPPPHVRPFLSRIVLSHPSQGLMFRPTGYILYAVFASHFRPHATSESKNKAHGRQVFLVLLSTFLH